MICERRRNVHNALRLCWAQGLQGAGDAGARLLLHPWAGRNGQSWGQSCQCGAVICLYQETCLWCLSRENKLCILIRKAFVTGPLLQYHIRVLSCRRDHTTTCHDRETTNFQRVDKASRFDTQLSHPVLQTHLLTQSSSHPFHHLSRGPSPCSLVSPSLMSLMVSKHLLRPGLTCTCTLL